MLTLFTTAKPFSGHDGIIQRNALKSWTLLHADAEVILFGNDEGVSVVAEQLGLRHEPDTKKNEFGSNRIDYMFSRAQELARHDMLCYVNCDIILLPDFCQALEQVRTCLSRFLIVGRRWDTDITEPIDFSAETWREETRARAMAASRRRDEWWIDYFVFRRGLFGSDFPPLAVGRPYWDNYTVWRSLQAKAAVVDASDAVVAVHQDHDYAQHPQGRDGIWQSEESRQNFALAGGWAHLRNIADATKIMKGGHIQPNLRHYWRNLQRGAASVRSRTWFFFLGLTRPVRRKLNLRAEALEELRTKVLPVVGRPK
jgi:hypothetical protein